MAGVIYGGPYPKEVRYLNTIPVRAVDASTVSGFVENPTVTHSYYRQNADGWTLTSGHGIDAQLDNMGRVHTQNYTFDLTWSNWGVAQTIKVVAHELGHLIILDFATSDTTQACTAALITSSALPNALRPTSVKSGVLVVKNNSAITLGTYSIATTGIITISAGINPPGNFTAAAGGFNEFTVEYDRRT